MPQGGQYADLLPQGPQSCLIPRWTFSETLLLLGQVGQDLDSDISLVEAAYLDPAATKTQPQTNLFGALTTITSWTRQIIHPRHVSRLKD